MVTLIGMGSGSWEALSVQAQDAVRRAGLVFGAKRLLAGLPPECTARQFALYQPAEILETLAQAPGQDAAVLYSGDTGFYSGASGLLTPLRALGIPARVYPGVSSIQLLAAALGRPWQDWKLVSAHGCACDPVAQCMTERSVFFLTGGAETPAPLCPTAWWAKTLAPGKRPSATALRRNWRGRVLHRSACFWWKTSMSRTSAHRASRTKASSGARCP